MKKKFSIAIIFFIVGIVLAGIITTRAVQEAYRSRKIEKEIEGLKQEAQNIQSANETIQNQIDYYSTSQFVEKVSKDKMNMQKPDENVVVINQVAIGQPQVAGTQNEISQTKQDVPNYLKWWIFFFSYN
jgi:cell division protein FtsB